LAHILADDLRAAAVALPVLDLLVGETGLTRVAPVDRDIRFVGETRFEQPDEYPLRPLVVAFVVSRDLAVPIVGEADRLDLPADIVDVGFCRYAGMRPVLMS
jgi:hypothetical protein